MDLLNLRLESLIRDSKTKFSLLLDSYITHIFSVVSFKSFSQYKIEEKEGVFRGYERWHLLRGGQ